MSGVEWAPALVVLALGALAGTVLVWRLRKAGRAVPPLAASGPPVERRDLEAKCSVLIGQLRELEDTAAKRTPEQLARERYALELEAARTLQELDQKPARRAVAPVAPAAPADAPVPAAGSSSMRGFLWGLTSAAAVSALLFFVMRTAKPRGEGDSATGNLPERAAGGAPASEQEARLRAALERNPDDFDTRIELAQVYLGRQDLMAVWNETQYVLTRSPGHPRALSYQALVRLAMGQADAAETMLKQANQSSPDQLEPYLHLALVYVRTDRQKQAEATMAAAQKRFPDQAQRLAALLAEMQRQQSADAESGEAEPAAAPHPRVPAAAAPGAAAPAAPGPAAAGRSIAGTLELDPSLNGQIPAGAIVFVVLRPAGASGGPPVAVKRLHASFPLAFEVGSGDSMMGDELPERVRLEARVDSDGDPMSRPPSDPSVRADDVKLGTTNLRLVLKR